MNNKWIITGLLSVAILASCTTFKTVETISKVPTQANLERIVKEFPGTTLEHLMQGKTLYESKCTSCHTLKNPNSETVEGWKKIVPDMAKKAKIDAQTELSILKYVLAMRNPQ